MDTFRHGRCVLLSNGRLCTGLSCLRTGILQSKGRCWKALTPFPSIDLMKRIVHVSDVRPAGSHCLHLSFDDGTGGEVDFSEEDWSGIFAPLSDPEFFARFELDEELGTLVWPNGADIAPETLHQMVTEKSS
jgi:hypothetical protein